jgi:HAD superfamily hydrolase (TIGR01509 family)
MAPEITHVIFDNDGLLLDTEPFYTTAHQAVAARFGKVFDWSIKSRMIGLRAQDSARVMIETLQLPISVPEYLEARKKTLDELFPLSEPLPGAVKLTQHLHKLGIPMAVATSSDSRHYYLKITKHQEWYRVFQCVVMGDDPEIKNGKPNPDIFLLAAKRMQADPAHCLVFEDSPAGIAAARAAGMYAIAVPDPHMEDSAYSNAHQILRSLNELDPAYWGFAPYSKEEL